MCYPDFTVTHHDKENYAVTLGHPETNVVVKIMLFPKRKRVAFRIHAWLVCEYLKTAADFALESGTTLDPRDEFQLKGLLWILQQSKPTQRWYIHRKYVLNQSALLISFLDQGVVGY